jgi:tetratricopeptide (TPR) repeat protein
VNEEQGLHYLVMEYVRGTSAGAYVKEQARAGRTGLPEATALDLCIAATEGLAAAHAEGIIHRDLKPDNILIPKRKDGDELLFTGAKLADLGLVRGEEFEQALTATQAALGTPGYMAPEQGMDSHTAGKPADVFSVGATLYHLLGGKPPFSGSSLVRVLMQTVQEPHAPIASLRPDVSLATAALLDRCLAKEPSGRYPDAAALLEALKDCRAALRMAATMVNPVVARLGSGLPPALTPPPLPLTPPPSSGLPATAGATGAAARGSAGEAPAAPSPLRGEGRDERSESGVRAPSAPAAPPRRGRGRGWLVAVVLFPLLLAAGLGGLWWWDEQCRQQVAGKIEELGDVREDVEPDLSRAIAELEELRTAYIGRETHLRPAVELLEALRTRRGDLEKRKAEFDRLVKDGKAKIGERPADALELLAQAAVLGRADEEHAWPDLTVGLDESLDVLQAEARKRLGAFEKAEDAERRRQDFEIGYQAGANHLSRGEAKEAEAVLGQALKRLGDLDHVAKADAQALQAKARGELTRRAAFAAKLDEADRLLAGRQLDAAADAYRKALALWPETTERKRIEEGLSSVSAAVYQQCMADGKKARDAQQWPVAENVYLAALKERPKDPAASQALEDVRSHLKDQRYGKALEEGYAALQHKDWAGAEAAFQRAVEARPADGPALQGLRDARAGAQDGRCQSLLQAGRAALAKRDWAAAEARFREALELQAGRAEALQGQQQARLRSCVHFSLSGVTAGSAKVKAFRDRSEAQLEELRRQVERDRRVVEDLSRELQGPREAGKKWRPFEQARKFKELQEAKATLEADSRRYTQEVDRVKLHNTRELLGDVVSAASALAARAGYDLVVRLDDPAEATPGRFQLLAPYEKETTADAMGTAFRRNLIAYAPVAFDPVKALVPGADLGKALTAGDDVTDRLVKMLNDAYQGPLEKRGPGTRKAPPPEKH